MKIKFKKHTTVEFQNNLARLMYDNQITQIEMGKRLGRERKCVASWMNGESNPNIVDFMQMCAILKVEPDVLYFGRKVQR